MDKKKVLSGVVAASLAFSVLSVPVFAAKDPVVNLRILETTDIHTNIVNYDYYKDASTDEFGLAKTASLIKKARQEAVNSMLFDNGDLIQGNPLGDYVARVQPLKAGQVHPVYKAMNQLSYDAGNVGNHEFNYGLDFLKTSLSGAKFPYVNANVYFDDHDKNPNNDKNYFKPYIILDKVFKDDTGKLQKIKVGVIGFVPPQITAWDKANLEGKVITKDIVATANKYVPEMKKAGADVIIALAHSGFEKAAPKGFDENATYYLSNVKGIDAILFGHAHKVFPSKDFENIPGVDVNKGTINGVASVMPGFWGDHLGQVDLQLQKVKGKWTVVSSQATTLAIYDKANKKALVDADPAIVNAVKAEHEGTLAYVRGPVGTTTAPINSYFALVNDDPSIQIVTNAQKWYIEKKLQGTEYDGLPVLSVGAPFKAGGRNGASYYTDIAPGTIAIKNVSDLYVYPNTVKAVLVTGDTVKEWLEMSAGQFNQIDPNKSEDQALINLDFPTYNYDVIDGVTYQIDVTQPAKYDAKGTVVNPNSSRIKNLQFNGKEIAKDQKFIVVTNNYRASGGGNFPGLKGDNIVIDSPDENRQAIIDYILAQKTINPTADSNWSFAPAATKGKVTFESSPNAQKYLDKLPQIKFVSTLDTGFAKYTIDLSAKK
ncbi:bifunctional 2',3'-cyclic-nucleotide 2'-phosphodiesterase/3'-nucleotidase [Brevibacillus ginsengisoli]|uniref:bifunctional 2',3'-cyclic-nucleotide 2'-phosphodiesterase/3'-nucleotidase n=1 Tax=Brevibacillus ginsengisoli TaxID=363854 RepID=UPI003CF55BE2